jgi:hypothetical protein
LPHTAFRTRIAGSPSWLDHRVPRCLAVGDYDADSNLSPQPLTEALITDELEREVRWRVCRAGTMTFNDAVALFTDWQAGYRIVFGHPRRQETGGERLVASHIGATDAATRAAATEATATGDQPDRRRSHF